MTIVHIFFIVTWCALAIDSGFATPSYEETGECEGEQLCSYFYTAQQEYINSGEKQRTEVNATVDITCTSSGVYNQSDAKLYCMVLKQPTIFTNAMENSTDREKRAIQQSLNEQLGNWFCFVQSYNGKIPAVYHPQSEPDHVISLKKSIAAAFQANFEGTEEEEEIDPQSRHKSHYVYTPTTEEGLLKMHRKIRKADVSEYSTEEPSEDIDTTQDEEIQYRSGRLERSSGNSTVHLVNSSNSEIDLDTVSLSQALAASGAYRMELQTCRKLGKYAYGVQKRRILSEMGKSSREEDLKATIDKKKAANAEMKRLRGKLPSGSVLTALQNYDDYGDQLVPILRALMELESQYGVLTSHVSVMDDIMAFISYMPSSESSRKVREAVLMLLSTEGSLRSQMALLSAYDNAMDDDESNVILTHISLMEMVRIGFVIGMEERLARAEDTFLEHQLLLVFSSLATKGSDEVKDRVMNVLSIRASSLSSETQPDLSEIDLMLHALGNTGSKSSISLIFSFLDLDNDDYARIKLAVIDALGKVTDDPVVLTRLEDFIQEDSSVECTAAVIETLLAGFEYTSKMQRDIVQYSSQIRSHTLLYSLAEAVSFSNNTDLHSMMAEYLKKIKADDIIFDLIYSESSPLGSRGKRGTDDWDYGGNSDYNYVESLVSRQAHVRTYNRHSAYIDSKTIGINEANVKIAYGYFAGTNTHCDRLKTFGRCFVVGTLLSRTVTIADVKFDIEATTTSASVIAFVRIGSNTLLDYRYQRSLPDHCKLFTRGIAEYRQRLFTLSYDIFVYIGYLTLSVDLTAHFNLDVNANVCIGRTGTEVSGGLGAITPTAGITLSGGVTGNILEVARGGVEVSASFNYRLEPAASIQGCTAYCEASGRICLGIYESQPDSQLRLDTWYQLQELAWCGSGWFSYPCFEWGSRNNWDALSFSWSLGSQARRAVWQRCLGNLHPTCAAGALSSPLFSY